MRLDALGDYILFRNFLGSLAKSDQYGDHSVTLLGNLSWRDIAENWDRDVVDAFVWTDPRRLAKDAIYRYQCLKTLLQSSYDVLLAPTHSRTPIMDELASLIPATEKIATQGDRFNLRKHPAHDTTAPYHRVLQAAPETTFEFERNRVFFEALLNHPIDLTKPDLALTGDTDLPELPPGFVALVPGAGRVSRQWHPDKFAALIRCMTERYACPIVLVGDIREKAVGDRIVDSCPQVINLMGQTRTDQLVAIIAQSRFLISNETSAVHIAAAVNKPTICIANDLFFGRFHPYPTGVAPHITYVYPTPIQERLNDYDALVQEFGQTSQLDVDSIRVEQVAETIDKKLAGLLR